MKKNNNAYGKRIEILYMNKFKSLGFNLTKTSRFSSRMMDNLGIDLVGLPFYVQIKAGRQKNLNYSKEIFNIKSRIKESEIDNTLPLILIHHKEGIKGKERLEVKDLVIMTYKDFKNFKKIPIKKIKTEEKRLNYSKKIYDIKKNIPNKPIVLLHKKSNFKGRKRLETDDLIILTFKDFKKILNYDKSK